MAGEDGVQVAEIEANVVDVVSDKVDTAIEGAVGGALGDALGDAAGGVASEAAVVALREVRTRLGPVNISPHNFMQIVKYVMEVVEGKPIKGKAQKDLALEILKLFIAESDFSAKDKEMCNTMISSGAVGGTIDLVVDATQGRIDVNTAARVATGCVAALIARLCGRAPSS